jgi:biofilm PGA synthesis N-glycosyltransferase PgaC
MDLSERPLRPGVTVLVPAYNEAGSIAETIQSLRMQTHPADEIIVIDDCSTDGTGDVARGLGVTVILPSENTGSKAGAQNIGLRRTNTEYVVAIDADTTLAPDALAHLFSVLEQNRHVAAACGFVIPRHVCSIWERGRYIEYLFAFSFFKQIQNYFSRPLISSGCFSIYRTSILEQFGGWSNRTMAEDMDLTWTYYRNGYGVQFAPDAVCYPIEPHDLTFMNKQLKRWSHGFVQNLALHWRDLLYDRTLRALVGVMLWDGLIASLLFICILPLLVIIVNPLLLLVYLVDLPAVAIPAMMQGIKRREGARVAASLPCFAILRVLNGFHLLKALIMELVLGKSLAVYEKGH